MRLTHKDYGDVLDFYEIPHKGLSKRETKSQAEQILATKLCRCIKSVDPKKNDEKRAIKVCENSVLFKKGIRGSRFECKKRAKFVSRKGTSKKLVRIGKRLTIQTRRRRSKR